MKDGHRFGKSCSSIVSPCFGKLVAMYEQTYFYSSFSGIVRQPKMAHYRCPHRLSVLSINILEICNDWQQSFSYSHCACHYNKAKTQRPDSKSFCLLPDTFLLNLDTLAPHETTLREKLRLKEAFSLGASDKVGYWKSLFLHTQVASCSHMGLLKTNV